MFLTISGSYAPDESNVGGHVTLDKYALMKLKIVFSALDEKTSHGGQTPKLVSFHL